MVDTSPKIDHSRRAFVATSAAILAAASFGAFKLFYLNQDNANIQETAEQVFKKAEEVQKSSNVHRSSIEPHAAAKDGGLKLDKTRAERKARENPSNAPTDYYTDQPTQTGTSMSEEEVGDLMRRIRELRPKQDVSQEIIQAIRDKLGLKLDKERIEKGLAIAEGVVREALESANPGITQDSIDEATQVAFVAYEMTFAMVKASELYGTKTMEEFGSLSPAQLDAIVNQMNNAGSVERARFGITMQPYVTNLALYTGSNPGSSGFFLDTFLAQFKAK